MDKHPIFRLNHKTTDKNDYIPSRSNTHEFQNKGEQPKLPPNFKIIIKNAPKLKNNCQKCPVFCFPCHKNKTDHFYGFLYQKQSPINGGLRVNGSFIINFTIENTPLLTKRKTRDIFKKQDQLIRDNDLTYRRQESIECLEEWGV